MIVFDFKIMRLEFQLWKESSIYYGDLGWDRDGNMFFISSGRYLLTIEFWRDLPSSDGKVKLRSIGVA